MALIRLKPDGSRDRSFGTNGMVAGAVDANYGRWVTLDRKGRLLVTGIRDDKRGLRGVAARLIPAP